MRTIYKYPLGATRFQQIEMPQGAEILCVQTQNEMPCIWALIESNAPPTIRKIEILDTCQEIPENANRKYIGAYQVMRGTLVFHCFELLEITP